MATITTARLSISRDRSRKTATPMVTCGVSFTPFEINQMKQGLRFRLKCQLWGADSGLTGGDDLLFTYPNLKFFPDASPTGTEEVTFYQRPYLTTAFAQVRLVMEASVSGIWSSAFQASQQASTMAS